jgi:dTDP-4-amino-4,6-dideoxygalactose transaminase
LEPYQRLEQELANWIGIFPPENIVVCNTGTAALHLAFECIGISKGKYVLVPDYTFIACPRAVTLAGLVPIFIGCNNDLLVSLKNIQDALTAYGKDIGAILTVHTNGRLCPSMCVYHGQEKDNIKIVEDMAEAHGCIPSKDTDASIWSFYRNKIVHGEEGGCIAFKKREDADKARLLRSLGYGGGGAGWKHIPRGHNYRMTNKQAELISMSLKSYRKEYNNRRELEHLYDGYCPPEWRMPYRDSPWVYDIRLPEADRHAQVKVVSTLLDKGVQARHGFQPMTSQGEYYECLRIGCNYTHDLSMQIVCLPLVLEDKKTVKVIFDTIKQVVGD